MEYLDLSRHTADIVIEDRHRPGTPNQSFGLPYLILERRLGM
jgi:hypothetical protein